MKPAPFHEKMAEGPPAGAAHWVMADDGVRLRAAHYPEGTKGTVLLFSGRTEYCEKYGRAAEDFRQRGYATATIDWRGQGLSDRSGMSPLIGHVARFSDFQADVRALVNYVEQLNLPKPYYLVAHSMGGAIGLRAIYDGLPVNAASFSAPMWGIRIHPVTRPLARLISHWGLMIGAGPRQMPFTATQSYVDEAPFEGNLLTSDPDMYTYMRRHTQEMPELALGGPSIAWLNSALRELHDLMPRPAPKVSCIAWLGSDEAIVSERAIRDRMITWTAGRLELVEGARHEIMMELPELRGAFFDGTAALFDDHP